MEEPLFQEEKSRTAPLMPDSHYEGCHVCEQIVRRREGVKPLCPECRRLKAYLRPVVERLDALLDLLQEEKKGEPDRGSPSTKRFAKGS